MTKICCVVERNRLCVSPLIMTMKIIRVPWIRCRADEVDAVPFEMEWEGRCFSVLAYTEAEAREWWQSLPLAEKREHVGGGRREESGSELELF